MSKIPFFLRFATISFLFSSSSSADQLLHSRHLLHQPFFPFTTAAPPPYQPPPSSEPPSPSPHSHRHHNKQPETPPPHEKHPFSSASNPPPPPPQPNTFFPSSYPSSTPSHPPPSPPPPPYRASLPTFPANISSLLFPTHNKPRNNRHVAKLLAITVSVVAAAALLSLLVVVTIFLRRSRLRRRGSPGDDTKSTRTDSLHLFNAAPSDGSLKHKQPPKYTSSNTSSEFLYLGTLVNSHQQKSPISVSGSVAGVLELPPAHASSSSSSSSYSQYQKLGSPELRPLPPLPKLPVYSPNYRSTELLNPKRQNFDGDDNENDEFFSPSGSPGRKQSPPRVIGSNSCSVSSSNGSPTTSLKPKSRSQNSSNGSVSKKPVPTRPPPPPPPPPPQIHEVPATTSLSPPSDSNKKEEETLKPKLKPLHWDKVRASSSRVTVWDQIKSNSFQ